MKQSKILIFLSAFILVLIIATSSCKHYPFLPLSVIPNDTVPTVPTDTSTKPPDPGHPCSPDSVYFANDILPLINSNCAQSGCHDAASHKEGLTLNSYSGIMKIVRAGNPNNSKLYKVLFETGENKMPPAPYSSLTQTQMDMIKKWIQQGALNNSCGGGPCDTTNVKYSTTISPIINTNCLGCHSGSSPGGGVNFTSVAGVQAVGLDGSLSGSVHHTAPYTGTKAMPQGGWLNACQIKQIDIWIKNGAPNN